MAAMLPDFDDWWDYSNPAATEVKFREALPLAQSSGDLSYHAQLLTQIARTQGLQRRFDAAHKTLDEVEEMLTPELQRARIRYLLERGRVFNSSHNRNQARLMFFEAASLAESASEDSLGIDALHMLAIVDSPEQSMQWNLKALALSEKSDDPKARRWRGSLYNNIGWTFHDNYRDYPKALEMFEKALAVRREQGNTSSILIARWCVARVYRSMGRIDEALLEQKSLEKEHRKAGSEDGFVSEEIAECLQAQGKADEARSYFAQAYSILSKDEWFQASEPERLERLKAMGGLG